LRFAAIYACALPNCRDASTLVISWMTAAKHNKQMPMEVWNKKKQGSKEQHPHTGPLGPSQVSRRKCDRFLALWDYIP
jgi:hypothetical protein